jgi:2-polyprenyl-3-methyl-5-hydroxy-6-metoxy-1,4-benzoquinol methylase
MHSVPDVFHQIALALQTLQQSIEDGLFAAVSEDGALPAHASETLIWLGIARREDERLVLTEAGRRYFVPNQECYLGQYVCSMRKVLLHIITRLESLLKTGQTETSQKPEVLKSLVSLLYPLHQEEAQQVADTLFKRGEVKRVLDLGTGSGVWSIALARKKRDIRVDALDVPAVLESTRAFAKRCKVLSQFRFTDGDLLQTETWGEPPYDVIYLGYVCNGCSAADNQRILTACAQYLRPGGHLVLADYCADQMGTLLPALHALFQATLAREGGIYAAETYSGWCQEAGFSELEQRSVSAGVALFLARAAASQEHQEAVAVGATVAE